MPACPGAVPKYTVTGFPGGWKCPISEEEAWGVVGMRKGVERRGIARSHRKVHSGGVGGRESGGPEDRILRRLITRPGRKGPSVWYL